MFSEGDPSSPTIMTDEFKFADLGENGEPGKGGGGGPLVGVTAREAVRWGEKLAGSMGD